MIYIKDINRNIPPCEGETAGTFDSALGKRNLTTERGWTELPENGTVAREKLIAYFILNDIDKISTKTLKKTEV